MLQTAADSVLGMLWQLMEAGLEELKLLQTAILLITTNFVVQHESLAKVLYLVHNTYLSVESTMKSSFNFHMMLHGGVIIMSCIKIDKPLAV